jgi:hypothetical protein
MSPQAPAGQVVAQPWHWPVLVQTWFAPQSPQWVLPPQLLVTSPQTCPAGQTGAGQTQWFVASQTSPLVHVPQLAVFPQLLRAVPQVWPAGQVTGLHTHIVPLHVVSVGQVPQLIVPPQLSDCVPHVWPPVHVVLQTGVQLLPSALQVVPVAHVPHESVWPQPSVVDPQMMPCDAQVVGTQASVPPSGTAHLRLKCAPRKNVRQLLRQSRSPHSLPRWLRVQLSLKKAGVFGQTSVMPVLLPVQVTLPSVEVALALIE